MSTLPDHPNIVKLKATYEDNENVHLVMELCEGGELFDRIVARGNYSERVAANVARTIAELMTSMPRGILLPLIDTASCMRSSFQSANGKNSIELSEHSPKQIQNSFPSEHIFIISNNGGPRVLPSSRRSPKIWSEKNRDNNKSFRRPLLIVIADGQNHNLKEV
ncbi:hypothetical protein K1719_000399 [Acacia pycnantha]|nr:hypothetical protein K1719_000399 [Acacia pycnantha]